MRVEPEAPPMSDILQRILAVKRKEIATAETGMGLEAVRAAAEGGPSPRGFGAARAKLDAFARFTQQSAA